jgi:hypothetical protein
MGADMYSLPNQLVKGGRERGGGGGERGREREVIKKMAKREAGISIFVGGVQWGEREERGRGGRNEAI